LQLAKTTTFASLQTNGYYDESDVVLYMK